ncbi:MAG TPA: LysR family transcriptional regulator [Polyangia bacterium]|nr:LysR family transcriptional regulator [Polyangia bacterium]
MTVESLKTFCDLVETGSFSRAARLNFVTQSAVSQQLRNLERKYGRRLVERGPRRDVTVTDAGKLVYASAKQVVAQLATLDDTLAHRSNAVVGTVVIAAVYSVGLYTLPAPMKRFFAAHPQVNLRLLYRRTDEVYRACLESVIDLGIVALPARRQQLDVVPLRDDELVLVCPPRHPLVARSGPVSAASLAGARFIAFDRDIPTRRLVDRLLRSNRAPVSVVMELDNIETIKRSVEAGMGVSILPRPALHNEEKARTLVVRPFREPGFTRPIGIIFRRGREMSPAARAFLTLLERQLGRPPAP